MTPATRGTSIPDLAGQAPDLSGADVPLRVVVLFDTAGFVGALPLSGAATRTRHLNAALNAQGCPTLLLLCDLNPDSRRSTDWPLPVTYLDYDAVYGSSSAQLTELLRRHRTDVLVMSNSELTVRYGRALADAAGAALIYEMHDDEQTLLTSIGAPPHQRREAALLQSAAVTLADAVVAFTPRDLARARALGAAQAHLVPCGNHIPQPPAAAIDLPLTDKPAATVGFVGNLHYEPNLRALRYLAQHLAPHLAGRASVHVFGRYPHSARASAATATGELLLHGPVTDLASAIAGLTVAVAPLDSGGGMKLKMLDYLAGGLPVVATTEAVVGLDHPERVALLSRDGAMRDFAGLVDRLLADPQLRHDLGTRGRDLVARRYSWTMVASTAHRAYRAAATRRATSEPRPSVVTPEVLKLAWRTPYWLTEWRARASSTPATLGHPHG